MLSPSVADGELGIEGYFFVRQDRDNHSESKNINHNEKRLRVKSFEEDLGMKVETSDQNKLAGVCECFL